VLAFLLARPRMLTVALVLPVFAVAVVHPNWAQSLGADVWNVPALNDQVREAANESNRLDAEDGDVRQRIELKETLIDELLAGRATLTETTEKFMTLNSTRPQYMAVIRASYPGETDQEKMAQNVISFVLTRAPAERQDAVVRQLEAELRQMVARSGAH